MAAAVKAIRKQKLEAAKVRSVFAKYDADGSGAVDEDELMDALSDLGMTVSAAQASSVMKKYDSDGSGELNQEQFEQLVNALQSMQAAVSPRSRRNAKPQGACGWFTSKLPIWKHHERALVIYQHKWMQSTLARCA